MSAHTPGPWVWRESLSGKTLESAHGTVIDSAPYEGMWFAGDCAEADQRLIAAAPELLYILERIVSADDLPPIQSAQAREVIAKARGAA